MGAEYVLDASVAAKLFFHEVRSLEAARAVSTADRLIAPDLLFIEMASVAAKHARRQTAPRDACERAVEGVEALLDEAIPSPQLTRRAFEFAAEHGVSVYDGVYLALAEREALRVLTDDAKLVARATQAGLEHLVHAL
jgi:predicted nucleic acid-binding protein